MSDEKLKVTAQEGDIDLLYTVIQHDPYVLENIDSIPFVNTPLHIAASCGHLQFATEIMRLKPSFAWKLNPQGFTPIHVALQHGHNRVVLRFVDINKDLVRAKGREGLTPLHFVSQVGEIDLLAEFLLLCPDSIQDVTVRSETVLHIAVKNLQYEVLQVLLGWLKKAPVKGAAKLEKTLLNWKDETGNTILHISALTNKAQVVQWLVKTKIDLEAKNSEDKTSLDLATNEEIRSILKRVGAKCGSSITYAPTFADKLKSKITVVDKIINFTTHTRRDISEEQRNAFLVVAALVATTTYQFAMSPPGGVYQANGWNYSLKLMATTPRGNAGRSIMFGPDFFLLSSINTLSFLISIITIFVLIPRGKVRRILVAPMFWFTNCYLYSMWLISPNTTCLFLYYFLLFLVNLFMAIVLVYYTFPMMYKRLWDPAKRKIKTRNIVGGHVW